MTQKLFILLILLSGVFFLTSCTTYTIPVESFKKQFTGIDSANLRKVRVAGPIGEQYVYLANPINLIQCIDKNGIPIQLLNSPSIEMRITRVNNKKTVFYFDRTCLRDSNLVGARSRFFESVKTEIPLKEIKKIEIQDGRKNFHYIEK